MHADTPAFASGLSLADARARITSIAAEHVVGNESIALESALGRVLADDVVAPFDVPGFANSAMDGYALRGADLVADAETPLRLIGTILAGGTEVPRVEPNTCVRITTGAPLPEGADTVVMKEDSRIDGDVIVIAAATRPGANVRPAGEDYRSGDLALNAGTVLTPAQLGVQRFDDVPLEEIEPFIDWAPFYSTWEIRQKDDPRAKELYDDARKLLAEIIEKRLLRATAAFGLWRARANGDDIQLVDAGATLHTLRQQQETNSGRNLALADFVSPNGDDYVGAFAVTAGIGVDELVAHFQRDHDDYNSIMTKALADRLAEALAEKLHRDVRRAWYAPSESLTSQELIAEKYRGIRPAPGYPASPDHTEKRTIFELLGAEKLGMKLTESFAMMPAASVSGLYFAHPEARYFAVGKIGRDQVADYAARKGMTVSEVERWLAPNLDYEPADPVAV